MNLAIYTDGRKDNEQERVLLASMLESIASDLRRGETGTYGAHAIIRPGEEAQQHDWWLTFGAWPPSGIPNGAGAGAIKKLAIKGADVFGNVAYLRQNDRGHWSCALANGISAAWSYIGIKHDEETACKIAVDNAGQDKAAILAALQKHAFQKQSFEFV